ncbi:MAG: hypothetical protein GXO81_09770 [Chlorobi bacterium]|nr:hypothetical protein [Chlorobiota bacterium]
MKIKDKNVTYTWICLLCTGIPHYLGLPRKTWYRGMEKLVSENNTVATSLETGNLYDFKIMKEIADRAQDYLNLK